MKPLIIDTSTAIKWFIPEKNSIRACRLLDRKEPFLAPDLLMLETANSLARKQRLRELSGAEGLHILAKMPNMFNALVPTRDLVDEAHRLSVEVGHSARDIAFLALALAVDGHVITADEVFAERVHRTPYGPRLSFIGDL